LTPEEEEYIFTATQDIRETDAMDVLTGIGQALHGQSDAVKEALRPLYTRRQKELTE